MHAISSAESLEQAELLEQQTNKIEKLLDIIERIDEDNKFNKYDILPYIIDNLSLSESLTKLLKDKINLANKPQEQNLDILQDNKLNKPNDFDYLEDHYIPINQSKLNQLKHNIKKQRNIINDDYFNYKP